MNTQPNRYQALSMDSGSETSSRSATPIEQVEQTEPVESESDIDIDDAQVDLLRKLSMQSNIQTDMQTNTVNSKDEGIAESIPGEATPNRLVVLSNALYNKIIAQNLPRDAEAQLLDALRDIEDYLEERYGCMECGNTVFTIGNDEEIGIAHSACDA